jgi:hypothetical protein
VALCVLQNRRQLIKADAALQPGPALTAGCYKLKVLGTAGSEPDRRLTPFGSSRTSG